MQEGWAVVIGAAIALVGSIGAPWLTGRVDAGRRRREARRDALRLAIGDFIELTVRAYAGGQDAEQRRMSHNLASVAATRVALLLEGDEAVIEQIGDEALDAAVLRPPGDPEGMMRLGAYQSAVHRWFRGELPASRIRSHFDATLAGFRGGDHPLFSQAERPVE